MWTGSDLDLRGYMLLSGLRSLGSEAVVLGGMSLEIRAEATSLLRALFLQIVLLPSDVPLD